MSTAIKGRHDWRLTRDDEGHREYRLKTLILHDREDGPFTILNTAGLPLPGAPWDFGNDIDLSAWCRPNATVVPKVEGEPVCQSVIEQVFSTRPPSRNASRCQDNPIEDPLLEPNKVSGGSSRYTEEATVDRFGFPILTSSHEMLRGPQTEFQKSKGSVRIEQNVAVLNLALLEAMVDHVNDAPLWGRQRRCVRLASYTWEKKYHGLCSVYYTRVLEFEFNSDTWDRDVLDEGTKVLHGHWDTTTGEWVLDDIGGNDPDPANPAHFDQFKDRNGENARVVLNGHGLPSSVITRPRPVPESPYYVAILNGTGQSLTDDTYFIRQVGGDSEWDSETLYPVGSITVVTHSSGDLRTYIATAENQGADPSTSPSWLYLANDITDRGEYDELLAYEPGDRVTERELGEAGTGSPESAGYIHIEKYDEVNMLVLGIPTDL